jgi:hypothetical protein
MNSRVRQLLQSQHLSKVSIVASVVASFMLTAIIVVPNVANASLGLFSLLSEGVTPTYISRIPPGAAFEGNLFHYYPEEMAIPAGTTVAWFKNVQSLYSKQIKLIGSTGGTRKEMQQLIDLSPKLKVRVWKKFELENVKEALQALSAKERDGRILLNIA